MRFLVLLIFGFLIAGCSKQSGQTSQTPTPPKKMLSGIFEHKVQDDPSNFMRWDFRTDGTVVYKMSLTMPIKVGDGTADMTAEQNGKGVYTIQDDRVTADVAIISTESFSPSYGTKPKVLDIQTNEDIFRIDGDDLIHLSIAVVGEQTNADNEETRYIRKR